MNTTLALEPIEKASIDELRGLQLKRLKSTLSHAYANSPVYRRKFDLAGVHPDDCKSLADLALMLVYHRLAQVLSGNAVADASNAPGFLSEAEVIQRYAEVSGRDLTHFGFYLGLGAYKLAAILEGIHFRYLQGQTVGEGFDRIGEAIHPLLETGLAAIKEN